MDVLQTLIFTSVHGLLMIMKWITFSRYLNLMIELKFRSVIGL